MASSRMAINWSAADGINLIQLTAFVTGDSKNAGATAAKAIDTLGVERKRAKINGAGKEVWTGSYDDAVRIAKHLRASEEQLARIEEHFQGLTRSQEPASGGTQGAADNDMLDITLFPSKESVVAFIKSDSAFPVVFNKEVSAWLGFNQHCKAREQVRKLEAVNKIKRGVHFNECDVDVNLSTGRVDKQYCFTVDGFKLFCLGASKSKAKLMLRYLIEVEKEMKKKMSPKMCRVIQRQAAKKAGRHLTLASTLADQKKVEAKIRDRLAMATNGKTEVSCLFGRVDVLTDTHVIEVKQAALYKSAIGQVVTYSQCFPGKRKRIHLFAREDRDMERVKVAHMACEPLDIEISVEFV